MTRFLDCATRTALFPDRVGEEPFEHCHEEMTYLAGFLPELYETESEAPAFLAT